MYSSLWSIIQIWPDSRPESLKIQGNGGQADADRIIYNGNNQRRRAEGSWFATWTKSDAKRDAYWFKYTLIISKFISIFDGHLARIVKANDHIELMTGKNVLIAFYPKD